MAEGDGEGVGGVGRFWGFVEVQEGLDHQGDLVFAAAAVGGDELLDLERLVEGDGEASLGGGEQGDGAGLADGDGGADVANDEVFYGDFIRAGVADYVGQRVMDANEALGDGRLRWGGDRPEVEGGVAIAFDADEAVAGYGQAGVYAEDGDWLGINLI